MKGVGTMITIRVRFLNNQGLVQTLEHAMSLDMQDILEDPDQDLITVTGPEAYLILAFIVLNEIHCIIYVSN